MFVCTSLKADYVLSESSFDYENIKQGELIKLKITHLSESEEFQTYTPMFMIVSCSKQTNKKHYDYRFIADYLLMSLNNGKLYTLGIFKRFTSLYSATYYTSIYRT